MPVMVEVTVTAGGVTVVARKLEQWEARSPASPSAALSVTAAMHASEVQVEPPPPW